VEDNEKKEKGLTPRQRTFVHKYIETGNATQSYIDAGYKSSSRVIAEANARQLLGNRRVKPYIDALVKERDTQQIASAEEVLRHLTSVLRGELTEEIVGFGMHGDVFRTEKTPSIKEQVKAAELLGKRYILFTDKTQNENTDHIRFIDNVPNED